MPCLLIDISNSYTKLVRATTDALIEPVRQLPTASLSAEAISQALGAPSGLCGILLSSVVPQAEAAVAAYAGPTPLLRVGPGIDLGIGIDYPNPSGIGADRLANAAGAAHFYRVPAVVVDFGTALTFDVLALREGIPTYLGGVIAPGLEAMTHYLHQRTALLPRIDLQEPTAAIGRSTRDAMMAGAIYGYRGLVREILHELERELGTRPRVIATGGYADLIAQRLEEIDTVHPHLTLEGLRVIANRNLRQPSSEVADFTPID